MTEARQQDAPNPQSNKRTPSFNTTMSIILILLLAAAATLFAVNNPQTARRVLLVALGFGGVVMVHEMGHFTVAKLGGIKVEALSIGFPPLLLGIRKLKKGLRVRLFPSIDNPGTVEPGDDETEYCIGLLPVGGFVKMLGQSDSGPTQKSSDPRSYLNRPVWIRIAVVAAGVVFNTLAAMALFIGLFLHGIELAPPLVGAVVQNSPADIAGFKPGDRITEVNGKQFLDYTSITLAAALSADNKKTLFTVKHPDGGVEIIKAIAEKQPGDNSGLKSFGIIQALSLTVSRFVREPDDIENLYQNSGLRPGDTITAFNGQKVAGVWQMEALAENSLTASATLTVSRQWPKDAAASVAQVAVPMICSPTIPDFRNEYELANIYSIVPRLKVFGASAPPLSLTTKMKNWLLRKTGKSSLQETASEPALKEGDCLLKVGDVVNPTYRELREQTAACRDKDLPITVLRTSPDGGEKELTVSVRPYTENGRVLLGILPVLDMDRPVVARTINSATGLTALQIPSGATIVSVDGQPVESFYDVVKILRSSAGQRIGIEYRDANGDGGVRGLTAPQHDAIRTISEIAAPLPLENFKETYRAQSAAEAVGWGVHRTWQFIAQSYLTLKRLITGNLPTSSLTGPVGIFSISYQLAGQSLPDLLYFLGLISSCLAVMNLLPIPIVDGGVIVLLIIEKITGKPLSEKIQQALVYAGLAFLLTVFLWITFNDILRLKLG